MFSQYSSSTSSRGRRPKDKETRGEHSTASSTSRHRSSRRDRDSYDRPEHRSPPPPTPRIYSQHNLTLDQLPPLPDSTANTPSTSSINLDGAGEDTPKAEARKNPLQFLQYQPPTVEDDRSEISFRPASPRSASPPKRAVVVTQKDSKSSRPTSPPKSASAVTRKESRSSRDSRSVPRHSKGKEIERKSRPRSSTTISTKPQSPPPVVSAPHSPLTPTSTYPTPADLPALTTHASAPQIPSTDSRQHPLPEPVHQDSTTPPPPSSPTFGPYLPQHYYYPSSPPLSYLPMMIPQNGMASGSTETQSMPLSPPYSNNHRSPPTEHVSSMSMHPYSSMTARSPPYHYGEPLYGMQYPPMMEHHGLPGQATPTGGDASSTRSTDDPEVLLRRVQEVLPDLSQLVNKYRETHGQLSTRELETKHSAEAQATIIAQKEFYLQALKDQIKEITMNHEKEKATLNLEKENQKREISERLLEVGDLQEKVKGLEEAAAKMEQERIDLVNAKEALEKEIDEFNKTKEQLQKENNDLLQAKQLVEDERAELEKKIIDLEALAGKLDEDYKMHTENLEQQLQERNRERMVINEKERADLKARHEQHVEDMKALHAREKEEAIEKCRKEQEAKFSSRIKDLEDVIAQHPVEIQSLQQTNAEERAGLEKRFEEEKSELSDQHKAEMEKHTAEWTEKAKHKDLELEKARETWAQSHEAARTHLEKSNEELAGSAGRLAQEVEKMKRIIDALGDATMMKSKGDSFYIDAFRDMSQQIEHLSTEYFQFLPIAPPPEIMTKIPLALPDFMDNTPASRDLRSAYVQHLVSNHLTYRIFQPFLFTLARRFAKADTLFQRMAEDMRAKSVRREAVWRLQTLKSIFTASEAKESTNTAAGLIVDEIVDLVRHFTDPKEKSSIAAAVRGIVKIAVETWRYARLERELITAVMPAAEDTQAPYEDWPEPECPDYPTTNGVANPDACERHVLLRLFPHVVREAVHEDLPVGDDKHSSGPCIYLQGKALYSDSPLVVARRRELMHRANGQSGFPTSRPQSSALPESRPISPPTDHAPTPEPPVSIEVPSIDPDPEFFTDHQSNAAEDRHPTPSPRTLSPAGSKPDDSISQEEGSINSTTKDGDDAQSETTAKQDSNPNNNEVVKGGPEHEATSPPNSPNNVPDWGSANLD